MPRLTIHKSTFTGGEISPRLLGRGDLRAYTNGAGKLRNVIIQPTGGVSRRAGTRHIDTLPGIGRLISFEFSISQVYLMVLTDLKLHVYRDGVSQAIITTPWDESRLFQLDWVQSADTLLIVHPDIQPKKITRQSHTRWNIENWSYVGTEQGRIFQPHHKFAADGVTLRPSGEKGTITLTASAPVFDQAHVGARFRIANKEVSIISRASPTLAGASVLETLPNTHATPDWTEEAFSNYRGYPGAVTFHQDRTVIGGTRDIPNQIWMSKSGDLFNFDIGEGLDDDAIEFALLSDQINAIRGVFSGRHLQVFTSGAEWMITGDPLTPENAQVRRQTQIGSPVDRLVPPRNADGATHFVPRNGLELREFLFTDVEQAYGSSDLAILSGHLIERPVDQDFDSRGRHLYIVMENGDMASLTIYRSQEVIGWSLNQTAGRYRSVAVAGDIVYLVTERDGDHYVERFDDNLFVDAGLAKISQNPAITWTGFDHLDGKTVKVQADGAVHADVTVEKGTVTLTEPATNMQAGLGFTHVIEPLPPAIQTEQGGNQGGRLRLVSATYRLQETNSMRLNVGHGFEDVPFKTFGGNVLDAAITPFTGDITIRSFGWTRDAIKPLWRIEQDTPLPFTLLSVTQEVAVND